MVCQNHQFGLDQPLRLLELQQRLVECRNALQRTNGVSGSPGGERVAQLLAAIDTCSRWLAAPRMSPASKEQVAAVAGAVDNLEQEIKSLCHCRSVLSGPRVICH